LIGIAGEYRHGTISPTFLATPVRHRVLTAKLIAFAAAGLLLAVFAIFVTLAMVLPWLAAENVDTDLADRDVLLLAAGVLSASALWGALGVAVGSVVPNQVGAIVITLVWLLIIDNIVSGLFPGVAPFTPGGVVRGLMRIDGDDLLTMWAAAAVTLAYITILAGLGAAFVLRRDVT
jgi:ABC-type transport system involved in multi-copper enzyme maturation permease subunit